MQSSPFAPDAEAKDRVLYDIAFALMSALKAAPHWGTPLKLTRTTDLGSTVTTTISLPDGWDASTERPN